MTSTTLGRLVRMQDRLVRLLGNSGEGRDALVTAMLRRSPAETTSYWLQLAVSVGIATLGLVVGSTAVVIGAMLVAPLMGPIVGLAMGLASGSPFLVLRSAGRIGASVTVAVSGAALITLLLPFHELNPEILARTSPTLLDLVTAGFCALAGVYASLRPGSDTATTAAGTSISISLVPPLCASGYGMGTTSGSIAGGAALLFLTNLVAIVAVGTVSFLAAGFNRVHVAELEQHELAQADAGDGISRGLVRRLSNLFASKWGPALRFLMPFVLLAAVYVPLRQALDEVAWQVRVRAAVRASIERQKLRLVQTRVVVERNTVSVSLVLLGRNTEAQLTRARIADELRLVAGVEPRVEVVAVPDATAFAGLESAMRAPPAIDALVVPHTPSADEQLDGARERIRAAVEARWPLAAAGKPLSIDVGLADAAPLRLRVVHLGAPLGADAREVLERSLGAELERGIRLVAVAIPSTPLERAVGDLAFIAAIASATHATASLEDVRVCVNRPGAAEKGRKPSAPDVALAAALDAALATHPRVSVVERGPFQVRFVVGDCAPPARLDAPPAETRSAD